MYNMRMINPEYSDGSLDDFDTEFKAMLSGEYMDRFGDDIVESLDAEKDILIECLLDHIDACSAHDATGEDSVTDMQDSLTHLIQKDFNNLSRLKMTDEITISGDTLIKVVGELQDGTSVEEDIILSDESRIRGLVLGPAVHDIPPIQEVEKIKQFIHDSAADTQNNQQMQPYPFGLSIGLQDACYEDLDGNVKEIPDGFCVLAPLNYPGLKIGHIVKQES